MSFLADTNVVSELVKPAPNAGVLAWAASIERVTLSVITLEEVAYGLAWRPNKRVTGWWLSFVRRRVDVAAVTASIANHSGALRGRLAAGGQPRTQADMLIAATAAGHALTLVTRNTRDFAGCGVPVLDPFTS